MWEDDSEAGGVLKLKNGTMSEMGKKMQSVRVICGVQP
jgi:hypothetical protein